mgnify:CR=1 FL=1
MLGEQIKRCREKRGFTQEQLAEKIGVSIETISSIERGIKMPRLQNFVAIANQLGVSADELLQDELDFGFIAEANALSKKLEELSRADRKRIPSQHNRAIRRTAKRKRPHTGPRAPRCCNAYFPAGGSCNSRCC